MNMSLVRAGLAAVVAAVLCASCGPSDRRAAEIAAFAAQHDGVLDRYTSQHRERMTRLLEDGGAVALMDHCSQVHDELARELSEGAADEGVRLTRRGVEFVRQKLAGLGLSAEDRIPDGTTSSTTGDRLVAVGITRVLRAEPVCMRCHGDTAEPAVVAEFLRRHPDSAAVGLAADEPLGWIEFSGSPTSR